MAFSDFTYPDLLPAFGLVEQGIPNLFAQLPPIVPSQLLRDAIAANIPLATTAHSEMARSTWLVGPVLSDLWNRFNGNLNLTAGVDFDADPGVGLNGRCDYLIGRGPQRSVISPPVLLIFEAKWDSIPDGLGQCIAAMVGAQRYNLRHNAPADVLYGCVTTGMLWKFLRLVGHTLTVDLTEYTIQQVDRITGILMHMIGPIPHPVAAA